VKKKWVITISAVLVLAITALTAHHWVPPVVKFVGEKLLKDEKVSRLNDLFELISKIVTWSGAAIWFFVSLWKGDKKDGNDPSQRVIVRSAGGVVALTGSAKVDGDVFGGSKYSASGGSTIIVQREDAAGPPPLTTLFQLPPPPGDFTGREADLRELLQAIEHGGVHISGLQGQGGVGKTALALKLAAELAPRFPDAQIFLDLKGAPKNLTGAGDKPLTAAEALGFVLRSFHPEAKLPEGENELHAIFCSVLHGKRVLLLMDNARDAAQVQLLIPPAGSALLVTSRPAFALPGLKQKKLDTLPPGDAKKLLLAIAPRIGNAAEAIAKSCGYLALALRLAATAIAEHTDLDPESYAKKLADESKRMSLLPQAGLDPSMEASIGLSYNLLSNLLDPEMQTRWRMLGVFPDSFDVLAAAAVWETGDDAAQGTLSDLVKLSMLDWDEATHRYRLHDLMRDFARGKLTEEERDATALRHSRHYADVLGTTQDLYQMGGDSILLGLALFDLERGNIEVGQAWAAAHAEKNREGAQLCSSYPGRGAYVLNLRQHPRDGIRWLESAVAAARALTDRRAEGAHLGNLGNAYRSLGEYRRAIEYHEQHLAIAREIGDRRGEGNALGNLGVAYHALGEPRRAIEYYEQALVIDREIGDRRGEGQDLGNLGNAYQSLGEYRRAIEYHEQALVIMRELADRRAEGQILGNLGNAYSSLGEYRRAIEYLEKVLAITREIGDRQGEGGSLGNLGSAYHALGEYHRAVEYHNQALAIDREIGDRRGEGQDLGNLGNAYHALGEYRRAIEYHEQQLEITREIGDRHGEGNALGNLGNAYHALGEYRRAIEHYECQLAITREIGDRQGEGNALWNMSTTLYPPLGERRQAIARAEAALEIYEQIESPYAANVRQQLEIWRGEP